MVPAMSPTVILESLDCQRFFRTMPRAWMEPSTDFAVGLRTFSMKVSMAGSPVMVSPTAEESAAPPYCTFLQINRCYDITVSVSLCSSAFTWWNI
jgi:hypothetical protein